MLNRQDVQQVLIGAEEPGVHVGAKYATRRQLVADRDKLTLIV